MNGYQQKLYDDLMSLTDNEAFYFKDFRRGVTVYRIFNYRLASYTEFLRPSAMECRGIMFQVESESVSAKAIHLVSLPMEKFFNLNENPMTMDLDLSVVKSVELKADGSLISTYVHYSDDDAQIPYISLKTKGSINSDQAIAAMDYIRQRPQFEAALLKLAELGYTVNMEWCAPDNRIVLSYAEPVLTVLNIRRHSDGGYMDIFKPSFAGNSTWDPIRDNYIDRLKIDDPVSFVAEIPAMEDVEGYVVELESGQRIKIKTEWYLVQHRAKDSINSPRRLFEACIEGATDDLRSLFYDDPVVITMIEEMETFAEGIYNGTVEQIETFYDRNKGLERKEYAILGQKELEKRIFGLAMSKYLGREVDYKAFLRKNYKSFGVADDPVDVVEYSNE